VGLSVPNARDPHPLRSLGVLSYVALSFALAQTTVLPALPRLITGLHTNANNVTWTLTAYFLSAAMFTPILGRLGDMFGKRRLLVIAMTAFGTGALISAATDQLGVVVAGRALQGLGGAVFPLCFGIARDLFPPEQVARSVGLLSAMTGVGGSVGLVMGGVISDQFSWHWIFWVSAFMGGSSALATQWLIKESPVRSGGKVDIRGALVLGVGLSLPLFAISRVAVWGWTDARTLGLIAAGLAILASWVQLERRTAEPLVTIALLRSPPVLLTNLATLFIGFGMMAIYVVVPQLAQAAKSTGYGFGLNATSAGLLLFPGSLLMMALGPVSAGVGTRVGHRVPLALGGAVAAVSLVLLGLAHGTQADVVIFGALAFGGIGLAFAALPNMIIDSVDAGKTGESSAFNFVVLRVGNSLGAQVGASLLAGSIVAGGALPTNHGYTNAFFISAGASLLCAVTACLIPHRQTRHARNLALEQAIIAATITSPAPSLHSAD
jgi:MFS family permease